MYTVLSLRCICSPQMAPGQKMAAPSYTLASSDLSVVSVGLHMDTLRPMMDKDVSWLLRLLHSVGHWA